MNWFKKLKSVFGGKKSEAPEDAGSPPLPIRPGKQVLRWLASGFRFPARSRVYTKRKPPVRFIDRQPVTMSFRQARLHDIYTSMREANEIRRSHRERQLEARATCTAM